MTDSAGRPGKRPEKQPRSAKPPSPRRQGQPPRAAKSAAPDASPSGEAASTPATSVSIETPVNGDEVGQTVLALLRRRCPGESWSRLQDRVERGRVSVNRVPCLDGARRLVEGDVLSLQDQGHPAIPKPADAVIVFADSQVIVVEKPAGMMTQRREEERNWPARRKALQPSLEEALGQQLARSVGRGTRPATSPLRCVHRLDRDTSGLLVFARTATAESHLVNQFRQHLVHRVYHAVVHGQPQDGTIVSQLVRDRGDGRRGSVPNPKMGQRAVTHVRLLEPLGAYSLVECRLETGRTNQIRIHMAEEGHQVCGDVKYDQPLHAPQNVDRSGAPRLALHAAELGFRHPVTEIELRFQMPFPPDMERWIETLRRATRS